MVRDNRHSSAYLFGAICPARGVGAAVITPAANTAAMNAHLAEISTQVAPGAQAVLVLDRAGWHQRGKRLCVPNNITLLDLPPYAPELNTIELIWADLKRNVVGNFCATSVEVLKKRLTVGWQRIRRKGLPLAFIRGTPFSASLLT